MEHSEAKELAQAMKAGFTALEIQVKELDEKFNDFRIERATEKGYEIKQKVEHHNERLMELEKWKLTADTTINALRRISWALLGTVGTILLMIVGAIITYVGSLISK